MKHHKLIILGSGPAGYTAAIYAARANLSPVLITGIEQGGQLMQTTDVENWPADYDGVQGPDLMDRFLKHSTKLETKIINDEIFNVNLNERPLILEGDSCAYSCESLIIATGASAKYLGIDSEAKYLGRGVSACATCDGFFFRGLPVCVVGGGNTAMEEILYLSNIASKVHVVHRRDQFRAEPMLVDRVFELEKEEKIKIYWQNEVQIIDGDAANVTGVTIRNTHSNNVQKICVDGVFIAIGHTPNTKIFKDCVDMTNGYINTKGGFCLNSTATNIPGVFAAGDVQDHVYRQAITSAASGCMAALDAQRYLENLEI